MYKVIFQYEDGTVDEVYVESITEAMEYEDDPDFAGVETVE